MNLLAGGMHEAMCARRPRRSCTALRDMEGCDIHLSHSEMTASSLVVGMMMVISKESRYSPSHITSTAGGIHFSGARVTPSSAQMPMRASNVLRVSRY